MRLVFGMILFVVSISTLSQENALQTIDLKQGNANSGKQFARQDQRGTEKMPFFIKGIPDTERDEKEAAQREKFHNEETEINRGIRDFTGDAAFFAFLAVVVAGVQAGFFWWQLGVMKKQFIASRRPRIRVKHVLIDSEIWQGEKIYIRFVVTNVGEGEAEILECNVVTLVIPSNSDLPPLPPFSPHTGFNPQHNKLPSGITYDFPKLISRKEELTDAENAAIRKGKSKLYCFGYVQYRDELGGIRKTAFCRVLSVPARQRTYQDMGRLVKYDDPDYEYED